MKTKKTIINRIVFVIACLLLIVFTATAQTQTLQDIASRPKVLAPITNTGSIDPGLTITFAAKCTGDDTRLVICRDNAICNTKTLPEDLTCTSTFSNATDKSCAYTTSQFDEGLHDNDIATCCNINGACDTTPIKIDNWIVYPPSRQQIIVVDGNEQRIPTTIEVRGNILELSFANQPITKLIFTDLDGATIGLSTAARGIIEPPNVKFVKTYALDLETVNFTDATLFATATSSALYQCNFWDFTLGLCLGSWELIQPLTEGTDYSVKLTKGAFGFAEGYSTAPLPINQTKATIQAPVTNDGPVTEGDIVTFTGTCIGENTRLVICRENTICNTQTPPEDLFCTSSFSSLPGKSCPYTTSPLDADVHSNDIATCCNTAGECDTNTVLLEPWIVTRPPIVKENITNITATPIISPKKKHFKLVEDAIFNFEYITEAELMRQGKTIRASTKPKQTKRWVDKEIIDIVVRDDKDQPTTLQPDIEELREGKFKITLPKQRAFRAGKYTLEITLTKNDQTYTLEQDFLWGVLAINVDKSIYLPNEESFIGMAVLDDEGKIVCDADVTLKITNPANQTITLTTTNKEIKISPECQFLGVTKLPDYYTNYTVANTGNYTMNLTAITKNGVRTIQDVFIVQNTVAFDVTRQGPTRIYPLVPYTMNFTIKANQAHQGIIREYVPALFNITPQPELTTTIIGDAKVLTWDRNLVNEETTKVSYEFDAPDVSPEFYLLGPLDIGAFKEARQWQIASDAIAVETDGGPTTSTNTQAPTFDLVVPANATMVVVTIAVESAAISSVTDEDGDTYVAAIDSVATAPKSAIYYSTDATENTLKTITVTFDSSAADSHIGGFALSGAETVSPIDATGETTGTSSSISQTFSTNTADSIIVWSVANDWDQTFTSPGVGQDERYQATQGGGTKYSAFVSTNITGSAGSYPQSVTASSNNKAWTAVAAEIKAAAVVDTDPPTFSALTEDPEDGNNYSLTQFYEFNVTVTDASTIDEVIITFNNTNFSSRQGGVYNLSNIFSFNITGLAAATYNYIWSANDSEGNFNATTTQSYTVTKQIPTINLTLNGTAANLTIEFNDGSVNITAHQITGESSLELLRDTIALTTVGDPTISLSNISFFTGIGDFNITALAPATENFTRNFTTFYVLGRDTTAPTINLSDPADNNITDSGNITFTSNATDSLQLLNATLFHNLTGTFTANESTFLNGTFNETSFSLFNVFETSIIWNVLYCDNSSNCAFAVNNFTVNSTLQAAAGPPTVGAILDATTQAETLPDQGITEDGIENFVVTFNVTNTDVTDIDLDSANLSIIRNLGPGGANNESINTSCVNFANTSTTEAAFICTIDIYYWFLADTWNITAGIQDFSNNADTNTSTFTITETTAIVIGPGELTFGTLTIGQENITAQQTLVVNNTANADFKGGATDSVNITGQDLKGPDGDVIGAPNFTIDIDTGGTPPAECSAATALVNDTTTAITNAFLTAGNRTAGFGNESLFTCLTIVPSGISAQQYSTNSTAAWSINV